MAMTSVMNDAGNPEEVLFRQFRFACYRLVMRMLGDLNLVGFKGSALRGSFGHAFRQAMCVMEGMACEQCPAASNCFYVYAFETKAGDQDAFLRNKGEVSRPYIIRPPQDGRTHYREGDELAFEFILIGTAIDYLEYFARGFIQMGQQGLGSGRGHSLRDDKSNRLHAATSPRGLGSGRVHFFLDRIESLGKGGGTTIYRSGDREFRRAIPSLTAFEIQGVEPAPPQCTLHFVTPIELNEKGRYPEVDFGTFFRSLLRRIVTLAHIHCGIDCTAIDFTSLSRRADTVRLSSDLKPVSAKRFSNRKPGWIPLCGKLGKITISGDLQPFWPYLMLGEFVHVGKKTTLGFGQYELIAG